MSALLHAAWSSACDAVDGPHGHLPTVAFFVLLAILAFRRDAARYLRSRA